MKNENIITILVAAGLLLILFVNITRVVWRSTAPDPDKVLLEEIACLQGGGVAIMDGLTFTHYIRCEPKK